MGIINFVDMKSLFSLFFLLILLGSCSPSVDNKTIKTSSVPPYSEIYEGDIDLVDSVESEGNKLTVFFSLKKGCKPCEKTKDLFNEAAFRSKLSDISNVVIKYDDSYSILNKFLSDVATPLIVVLNENKEVIRIHRGFLNEAQIMAFLSTNEEDNISDEERLILKRISVFNKKVNDDTLLDEDLVKFESQVLTKYDNFYTQYLTFMAYSKLKRERHDSSFIQKYDPKFVSILYADELNKINNYEKKSKIN